MHGYARSAAVGVASALLAFGLGIVIGPGAAYAAIATGVVLLAWVGYTDLRRSGWTVRLFVPIRIVQPDWEPAVVVGLRHDLRQAEVARDKNAEMLARLHEAHRMRTEEWEAANRRADAAELRLREIASGEA